VDRVLGYEASYAGTSFATLEWKQKNPYGSKLVNIVADNAARLAGRRGLTTGVKTKQWDLGEGAGGLQKIRTRRTWWARKDPDGCCCAQNWADVQFKRMPNA
jgi:TldD protein